MNPNEDTEQLVTKINSCANEIFAKGGGDEELLMSIHDHMGQIKKIMDASTHSEMDDYCQKYNGFYSYMFLLEKLAENIGDGTIKVPK